jgi:hypothetical protein
VDDDRSSDVNAPAVSRIASMTVALAASINHGCGSAASIARINRKAVAVSPTFAKTYGASNMIGIGGADAIRRRATSGCPVARWSNEPRFLVDESVESSSMERALSLSAESALPSRNRAYAVQLDISPETRSNFLGQCAQVPAVGPYTGSPTGSRISKISSGGVRTTVIENLPSSSTSVETGMLTSGVADVAFIGNTLYGLLSGAGCSHGVPSVPNQVFRVNGNGMPTMIANLSHYYQTNPTANEDEDDFEPDGTPYSMIAVRGDLYVVEPNHGSLDRVSLDGSINRVADISTTMGHIVPTTVSYHGDFFVGNLNTFPVVPGSAQILKVTPSGELKPWVTGLSTVLGSVWDGRGRLYVLESTTVAGNPTPGTGRIRRIDPSGQATTIAENLFLPSALTLGPDGNFYVSNVGFGPLGLVVGHGEILKVAIN